jgi:pre-rRNA-processing protein TSR2
MDLRSGHVVGQQHHQQHGRGQGGAAALSPAAKEGFEEGVGLIFSSWTALVLAVENQWGGPDSERKADHFIEDALEWFYRKRGARVLVVVVVVLCCVVCVGFLHGR